MCLGRHEQSARERERERADGLLCAGFERQAERARELAAQREAVETARKALKKRAPKEGAEAAAAAAAAAAGERADAAGRGLGLDDEDCGGGARGGAAGVSGTGPVTHQYYLMTEEVYRARLQVTVRQFVLRGVRVAVVAFYGQDGKETKRWPEGHVTRRVRQRLRLVLHRGPSKALRMDQSSEPQREMHW